MRLTNKAGRITVTLILSLLLPSALAPIQAFGQSVEQAQSTDITKAIENAESHFRAGEQAFKNGDREAARKSFDQAIDSILGAGVNLRSNSRLDAYYRDLVERINKFEARTEEKLVEDRVEIVEPAALDEISKVDASELAAVTQDGIKIFGNYDFDFSVAPPVLQYLSFFINGRGRSTMETGLKRSGRYRQMAERIFKEERVPLDLIWLAQAESVWKPNALSWAAAKGIWQFIPSTGLRYGLSQNAWVDNRSHPELSTRAAARYLRFLHDYFAGDWMLAMAAYNSGEGRVESAISRCGYADFWELYRRNLLPAETRNYVPIILSIVIVSKNQKRYGFNITPDPALNHDTFDLPNQTDLKVVADLLGMPYETVQEMNPELRRGMTPPDERYTIKIPRGMRKQFEVAYANLPEDQRIRRVVIPATEVAEARRPVYTTRVVSLKVRRGDTLSSLARRYGVSVDEIARLNRLSKRGELRQGQVVKVPSSVQAGKSKARSGRYASKKVSKSNARGKAGKAKSTSRRGASKRRR
jgi:membrane-bound lytic murein transglycosylase D